MGWFSPALLPAKLLIQEAWIQLFPWDDPLPDHLQQRWSAWLQEASALQSHPVNRFCTSPGINVQHRTLHGFSDASSNAYGGAVYLRTMNTDTSTTVELLTSKSKLAPKKKQTIARLELCGAHLLSKLLQQTAKDLGIPLDSTYAWCDSAVVLGWLKTSPGRLKTYVSHRVQDTVNRIPSSNWRYVNTLQNPADLISRGVAPGELLRNELWWKWPPWLSQSPAH